jgi:hypothetical protein
MLIERQSSNIENERDYLVMDEAPKQSRVVQVSNSGTDKQKGEE